MVHEEIHLHIYPQAEASLQEIGSGGSGCATLVAMMKPAYFWNLNDPALIGQLDFPGFR